MNRDQPAVTLSAEQRAAFRRFVRENHPDRGGDPEAFAAGLRAFREGRATTTNTPVHIYRSPRGVGHVTHWVRRRWAAHTRPPRVR